MEFYCGTDIIEISRIKDSIENIGENFISRIYTENEIKYCESKGKQKYQHYAVRFAAKEAIFKAISKKMSIKYELSWNQYEVLNDVNGRPYVNIVSQKNGLDNICNKFTFDISLSHCKEYAVANVIAYLKIDN